MEFYNYEDLQLEGEIWKDVVGWEEFYEVSSLGRIRCKYRVMMYDRGLGRGLEPKTVYPRIRKPKLNKHTGYLMVGLNGKGKPQNVTIHSMVAEAFHGKIEKKGVGKTMTANHIDGNKLNNRADNIEIISNADNIRHAFKTGLITTSHKVKYNGIEYYSKSELRRQLKMSERKMNKLIAEGLIEVVE